MTLLNNRNTKIENIFISFLFVLEISFLYGIFIFICFNPTFLHDSFMHSLPRGFQIYISYSEFDRQSRKTFPSGIILLNINYESHSALFVCTFAPTFPLCHPLSVLSIYFALTKVTVSCTTWALICSRCSF